MGKPKSKRKAATITWINWDVDLTWFGVIRGLEAEIRKKKIEASIELYNWKKEDFDNNMELLMKEDALAYQTAYLAISVEAMKRVHKEKYLKEDTRLKHMFDKLENYKHSIISNTPKIALDNLMDILGIDENYFDIIITSDTQKKLYGRKIAPKPSADGFNYVLKKSKCPPHNHVYVGDSFINDIKPAKNAGMYTIWVRGEVTPEARPYVNQVVSKVYDVPLAIRNL